MVFHWGEFRVVKERGMGAVEGGRLGYRLQGCVSRCLRGSYFGTAGSRQRNGLAL